MVEVQKLGLFTISNMRARPSAEIRVVEVQKLGTFYDFCKPRATLCGDSHGRGSKTGDFLRRPSAEIRVVEVQKLRTFYDFCGARATLCGDRARRSALAVAGQYSCSRNEVVSWFARLLSQARGRGFDSPPGPRQLRLENRRL